MARALQFFGVTWMAVCAALWIYIGLFTPTPDIGDGWMSWTVPRMIADTRFGLTFVPILMAVPGAWIWDFGRKRVKLTK